MYKHIALSSLLIFGSAASVFKTLESKVTSQKDSSTNGYYIAFHKEVSLVKVKQLAKKFELQRSSKINNEYFNRLYFTVDQKNIKELSKFARLLPNKEMPLTLSSIVEPDSSNRFSSSDELSGYQFGHYHNNQKYFLEDFFDKTKSKEVSQYSSINAQPILNKIKNDFKRDVVVAVLDTGVDITHPDINFYRSEDCVDGAIPIVNPQDNDGNGKAGDCSGWDFTKKRGRLNLPEDDARNGHGTHISGIISAKSGNGGLAGLSNQIKILPIKVIKRNENLVGSAITFTKTVSDAIEYAIEKEVDVINMSYGWASTVDSEIIREKIKAANEKGIFVVSAAGNDSNNLDFYPCNHEGVICVGASSPFSNDKDQTALDVANFSNYGGIVDMFAPGDGILSTYPRSLESSDKIFDQRGYEYGFGTSQAAPFISLALATALGLESQEHLSKSLNPEGLQKSMYARLVNSSRKIQNDLKWGSGGHLDLNAFINSKNTHYISPILKNLPVIKVENGKDFEISLPIQNYDLINVQNISVSIKSASGELNFVNSEQKLNMLKASSKTTLSFTGTIKDLDISFRQNIFITIKSDSFSKSFEKELVFGNNSKTNETKRIKISNKADIPFMLKKRRGLYANIINNVDDRHKDEEDSHFYFTKADRRTGEKKLVVVNFEGDQTKSYHYILPERVSGAFFNFRKVDLNYDNKKDFLLGLMIAFTDEEKEQGAKDYIEFHYLDNQLKPLYNKHVIEFRPEISAITGFRNINMYPFKRKDGSEMALPIYLFNGGIHEEDKPSKPWLKSKEPFRKQRIYYTELDESKMTLRERVINTYAFEQKLRKQSRIRQIPGLQGATPRARFFENIVPLALGEQNKDLFYRGENKVYLSIGFAAEQETYLLTLNGTQPSMIQAVSFEGEGNLTKSMLTQQKDPNGSSRDFFNTYLQNEDVEFYDPQSGQIQYFSFRGEDFRGLKSAFTEGSNDYLLFEFNNHFKLFNQRDTNNFKRYPLGRVSFINGLVFKELTQRIDVLNNDKFENALYVDSSSITRGNVFALKFKNGEFQATIRNNRYLGEGCVSMAPTNFEGRTYFTAICEDISGQADLNRIKGDVYFELNPIY